MAIELKWAEGKPKNIGMYFVAVLYSGGAGCYTFKDWNGEEWESDSPETVVAFISLQDFVSQLHVKWPFPESNAPMKYEPNNPSTTTGDDFIEI